MYPCSSSCSWGPLPQPAPCFWLIQARDKRNTSTKGNSEFQSAGPLRLMPTRGCAGSGEVGEFLTVVVAVVVVAPLTSVAGAVRVDRGVVFCALAVQLLTTKSADARALTDRGVG